MSSSSQKKKKKTKHYRPKDKGGEIMSKPQTKEEQPLYCNRQSASPECCKN